MKDWIRFDKITPPRIFGERYLVYDYTQGLEGIAEWIYDYTSKSGMWDVHQREKNFTVTHYRELPNPPIEHI